jgi:hypothetical protein
MAYFIGQLKAIETQSAGFRIFDFTGWVESQIRRVPLGEVMAKGAE